MKSILLILLVMAAIGAAQTNRTEVTDPSVRILKSTIQALTESVYKRGVRDGAVYVVDYYITNHQSLDGFDVHVDQTLWHDLTNRYPVLIP